jgi:GPH family glycoside/pentoside/hexuronide:cation symporter
VLLIGGIWDAINDPIIGVLADRVRTRWGRRRPLFLLGALPLSITFALLWWVPDTESQLLKACYYAVVFVMFDTAFTLLTIPYSALTAELTEDYDERTHLTGYRMAVSMAGGMIATIAVPVLTGLFRDVRTGYLAAGIIFGGLAALPYFLLFSTIRERPLPAQQKPLSVIKAFFYTFRNKAFRYAAMIYMTAWVTVNLVAALMQYYVTYWMDMAGQLEIILGLVQGSALVCIPVVVWLSGKMGKQRAYIVGLVWWAAVMVALAFLPQQARTVAYILAGLAGLGIAAAHVIPWSMVPDVIEADELETGQRREGAYYGFLVFIMKSGTAFTLAFMQWILHLTGYQPGAQQTTQTLFAIRMLIGPVPAVLLFASILLAWRFPISRTRHAELRAQLAEKRASTAETPAD